MRIACAWWGRLAVGAGVFCLALSAAAQETASPGPNHLNMSVVSGGELGGRDPELMKLSMDFQDASLKDVLKLFSEQTGINVIASDEVADRTVTLYLEEVLAMDALDQILASAGLTYERPAGSQIYIVKPKLEVDEAARLTETRVYKLRYARVSTSRLAEGAGGQSSIDPLVEQVLTHNGKLIVDGRTNSVIISDVPENFSRIEAVLNALDVKTSQLVIETELLETTMSRVKDLGIKWSDSSDGDLASLKMGSRSTRFPLNAFAEHIAPTGPTGFSLSTLSLANAAAVLQALMQDSDTKILARPKILTLDNEKAVIELSVQQAIGFQTTTGQNTGTTTASPERVQTGIVLNVTPQVNEGGFVTMIIEPSVTKVVTAEITPPTSVGGKVVDPKTRKAKAVVRIRDGETLVLGGLIDRSDQESVRKVPVLGDVPLVGAAFQVRSKDLTASELLVFVTPHILKEPDARVASAPGDASAVHEQEPAAGRQDVMEETLSRLERL